jgi:photosynthetic reaction center cytochrome c subunit
VSVSLFFTEARKLMNSKQSIVAVAGMVLFLGAVGVAAGRALAQSSTVSAGTTANGPRKAEEEFKNIQVLKGLPADQLIPGMQFITASLGVECQFCHVEGAFEKDDKKPKQTARKMMEMMFAINKNSFEGHREVTCYSCHRGRTGPVGVPEVMTEELKPGMAEVRMTDAGEATDATGPRGEQLFDRYLKAVGGSSAVEKVSTRVMKGTITFGDRNVPIDIFSKDPEKRISFTHTPDGDSVTAFDGKEGWLGAPKRPVHEMHGPDIDGAAMDADLHFAAHLKGMFSEVQVRGRERVGDHDAYVVVGAREGKTPLRLYFDAQSGLLLRLVRFGDTPFGWLPTQIDYADYRDAGDVKIPYRWTLARPSGRFTIQVTEVKQNVPVDDAKFAKPPEPPAEQKSPSK